MLTCIHAQRYYMHMMKTFSYLVHEMNIIIVIGGHVIHSYGRLIHVLNVITRGDLLLPPGDTTGPGRMDCIRTAPETARFRLEGGEQPNNLVNQSVEDGDQMATLFFNRAYLSMNNFIAEYSCHDTYILFYLTSGNNYF